MPLYKNGTPHEVHILGPAVELLEKHRFGYKKVPIEVLPPLHWICPNTKGITDGLVLLGHRKTDFFLSASLITPLGAPAFLGRALKLRVVIDVVGWPEPLVSEGLLPTV
jgi:hypothetical protein